MNPNIHQLATEVEQGLRQLGKIVQDAQDLDDRVEAGAALWHATELVKRFIEPLKKDLREEALQSLGGSGTWTHEADHGWCKVIVPEEDLRLKKGSEDAALNLRQKFPDVWEGLFDLETKVKVKKGSRSKIASMQPSEARDAVLDCLEGVAGTPRVSLKKG